MLRSRIIPCLLVRNGGLVKTVRFSDAKYVGDPINAVRIFNEKEVDELVVLDIDATVNGDEPNYVLIEQLASECRMPLCYGGGLRTVDQALRVMRLGVEKTAVSAAAVERPQLIAEIAGRAGSQSVVVVIDVREGTSKGEFEVWTHNGKHPTGKSPVELAKQFAESGAGEIVVNSIDRDGTMSGYAIDLLDQIRAAVTVPLTVLGGAGSLGDLKAVIDRYGIIGAAAGSLFVFKGAYRAVLINYPNATRRRTLAGG